MRVAFPRLPDSVTLVILREVRARAEDDPASITAMVSTHHESASPVPTGAEIASASDIANVRKLVVDQLNWQPGVKVSHKDLGPFDRDLGKSLHTHLSILPADAAHKETWNFLSAVVFPDLVWARFPDLHDNRFLGHPRNALRRVWYRQEILGELMAEGGQFALKEDEMVGLLERTALARNRRLAREVARCVLLRGPRNARTEWARDLYKRVTHLSGPLMLDVLNDSELESMVADVCEGGQWFHDDSASSERPAEDVAEQSGELPKAKDSGDLVLSFNEAVMAALYEIEESTGSEPVELFERLRADGGMRLVREVVGAGASDIFRQLAQINRLDCTFEALAVSQEYRGLFSEELLASATERLLEAGWFD